MTQRDTPFFVGYLPVPRELNLFLWAVTGALVVLAAGLGFWIGATQDDPGPGAFRFDFGRQTVSGVIELTPVPILHVTEGTERIPAGRSLLMTGPGKTGVMDRPGAEDGQIVTVSGVLLERGSLNVLQVRGGQGGFRAAEGTATAPEPVSLGRWRLAGEITDGKCLAGAMRPGRGMAHKACANLCVLGGTPPIFMSTQPVEGADHLLISGPEGSEIPAVAYDRMAQFISVEGEVTRRGDLLIFAMDPDTVEVIR